MNIGYDAKRLFLNDSGLGNYSRTLVSDMHRLYPSDNITLFSPRTRNTTRTEQFLQGNYPTVLPQSTPKALHAWWRSIKLSKVAKEHGVEIYHGLSNELPIGISSTGIKSVVTIHDLIFLRFPELYPRIDRHFYRRKSQKACDEADAIVAISQRTADDIVELLDVDPSKISVIHQGCDTSFSQTMEDSMIGKVKRAIGIERDYIVCIGTVEERKNQKALIEAYHSSDTKNDLDLVIIGRHTRYVKEVRAEISKNGIEKQVHLLSHIDFRSMLALLKGARMAVYPSKYEGFGLPVLEAMSAGVPIIAGSGSCLEEVGGEAARYFDPYDPSELKNVLDELSASPQQMDSMRADGLERSKFFSGDDAARKYHDLYESLLS